MWRVLAQIVDHLTREELLKERNERFQWEHWETRKCTDITQARTVKIEGALVAQNQKSRRGKTQCFDRKEQANLKIEGAYLGTWGEDQKKRVLV